MDLLCEGHSCELNLIEQQVHECWFLLDKGRGKVHIFCAVELGISQV